MIDNVKIAMDGKMKKEGDLIQAKAQISARVRIDSHCQLELIHLFSIQSI